MGLAADQHGVVGAGQLYALGLSEGWVAGRAEAGWLRRIHRGVYALGPHRLSRHGVCMAAVLACGEGALLSHWAAGELWRILPDGAGPASRRLDPEGEPERVVVDVTVPSPGGRERRPGLDVHRRTTLHPVELTRHQGIPLTTVERTLFDLAVPAGARLLERCLDEAAYRCILDQDRLRSLLARHRGERGVARLRAVLDRHEPGSTRTRSELEERFLALCRERGLPPPEVNARLHGLTVDFLWRDDSLVIEVDGRDGHMTRAAFQRDRDRDSSLAALGFTTLRFTWWDVVRRPALVAHRASRVLAR